MLRTVSSITTVALVCAALLAFVYVQTAPHIETNRTEAAWQVAFELAGGAFDVTDQTLPVTALEVRDKRLVGITAAGYGGDIDMLVAFTETRIHGVRVIRHQETPGLGDFIDGEWMFQFEHQPPDTVDTVTGATITSRAVIRALSAHLQTHLHDARADKP